MHKNSHKLKMIFLLLSFITMTSVWAKDIKLEEVSASLESIQLAAFKKSKAQLYKNNFLSQYDMCTISDGYLHRIFIVNIEKSQFEKVLNLTRKFYPDAFRGTKKLDKLLGNRRNLTPQSDLLAFQKKEHQETLLNVHSILHTHRNFF